VLDLAAKLQAFEDLCRERSEQHVARASDDFRKASRDFDALLHHFYLFSCCHWGCHGKEHVFEHLGGRSVSHLVSSHRLILSGYYDESMSLVRSVGEIANLLNLFWVENGAVRAWLDAPEKQRRKDFSPYAVRKRLRDHGWLIPFDDDHYRRLCEAVVHPTPETRPNAHDNERQPVLGAYFQAEGFETASWELYWALAAVAGPTAKLAVFQQEQAEKMVELTVPLFEIASEYVDKRDHEDS
jgi:hypothetical protein